MKKEHLHSSAIELAQEQGFVEYVLGKTTPEAKNWAIWIDEHPEINERVDEARHLVNAIRFDNNGDLQEKEEKIWLAINSEIKEDQNSKQAISIPFRRYITIAAIAASIILPLFIFLGDSNKIIRATNGEQLSYHFPDQSSAQLNSGSSLEYNPKKWEMQREVVLKGEAFFEVEKGIQFEVVTNNGSVVVLGTSFNVFSRGKKFEVSCLTGKVEVQTEEHTLVLNPGDAVALNIETKRLEDTNDLEDNEVDWLAGEYHFDSTAVKEVFEEMERQFNVKIELDRDVLDEMYTGVFMTENIDTALYQVCWPMSLVSNKLNNKIVIKRSGTE